MKSSSRQQYAAFIFSLLFTVFLWLSTPVQTTSFSVEKLNKNHNRKAISSGYYNESASENIILIFDLIIKMPLISFGSKDSIQIRVDDCLKELFINGKKVAFKKSKACNRRNLIIKLPEISETGEYHLKAEVFNKGGQSEFSVVSRDVKSHLQLLMLFGLFLVIYFASRILINRRFSSVLSMVIALGITSRISWYLFVPYPYFSHDVFDHIQYLEWMQSKWSIPEAAKGFIFFHPPLYYLISAVVGGFAAYLGSDANITEIAHFLSLLFSIGSMLVWVATALVCFKYKLHSNALLAIALVSLWPGAIFATRSITNDSLASFFASLMILFFTTWWRYPSKLQWFALCLTAPLALATKFSTLPLVIALPFVAVFKRISLPKLFHLNIIYFLCVVLFLLPYQLIRYQEQKSLKLIPNASSLNSALIVSNDPLNFFIFSIPALYDIPYFNAWSNADRRMYPLETLFKSSFTGEFNLGQAGRFPLKHLHTIACLCMAFIGFNLFYKSNSQNLPMLLIFLAILYAILINRYIYPYSCTISYRYTPYIIVPFSILAGAGLSAEFFRRKVPDIILKFIIFVWCYQALALNLLFLWRY